MISQPQKRKMNSMLLNVLLISGGIHVLALFVLGSITVYRYIIPTEAQFEAPPEVAEEKPPPDVKVEIRQQPPQQQQAMQNLSMRQVGNIAVSAVDVNLPDMQESFTVSAGLGGVGGGSLLGGTRGNIGIGMSDVSVFGLRTRAERILFVIDTNREMVTDAKGGLNSYKIIKDEITDMVGNLSTGTLFNVMLVDRRNHKLFRPRLVPAGQEVQQQLVQWLNPINANARNPGLEGDPGASRASITALADEDIHKDIDWSGHRGNETAFITQVAMEQNVDAIFFITGYHRGFEQVRRLLTEREEADWQRTISRRSYQDQLAAHELERAQMQERINKRLAEINAERRSRGQPPRVLNQRHGIYSNANELNLNWNTEHPGNRPVYHRSTRDVERYFRNLVSVLYTDKGGERPSVNVVLFLAGDEEMRDVWERQLRSYVQFFRGNHRIIRGLDEIRSARSSARTTN
ncbi:MAG: hypothetical protein EA353_09550 [Puniceicoccaceae bacterium]|nr:MAG: hypothetical protein EA353_09550 [Puniceicoccaceae bacterium]